MALFNHATKEVTAKLVYYGPGLCGKTTNLQWIHGNLSFKTKGKLVSLATQTDRTLFFDFLPVELGTIRGMRTRMQIYTVPGQVFYESTRRMVLKGCDAVVFVADSQAAMLDANAESLRSLRQNLLVNEIDPEVPQVIQYNKRDLPTALPISVLNERLNPRNLPYFEAVAFKGTGVEDDAEGHHEAAVPVALALLRRERRGGRGRGRRHRRGRAGTGGGAREGDRPRASRDGPDPAGEGPAAPGTAAPPPAASRPARPHARRPPDARPARPRRPTGRTRRHSVPRRRFPGHRSLVCDTATTAAPTAALPWRPVLRSRPGSTGARGAGRAARPAGARLRPRPRTSSPRRSSSRSRSPRRRPRPRPRS